MVCKFSEGVAEEDVKKGARALYKRFSVDYRKYVLVEDAPRSWSVCSTRVKKKRTTLCSQVFLAENVINSVAGNVSELWKCQC